MKPSPMAIATDRLENLRTLRFANLDAGFATGFATLVGGAFMVGFIRHLGGSDIWIGVLSAVPSLLGLLQIFGAIWGRSYVSYKSYVTVGGLLWRVFHIPLILLPFVALSGEARLWILFACVSVAAACVHLVSPIYNDWLAELVPSNSRGWFFSRRNGVAAVAGALAAIGGGVLLDLFRRADQERLGYSVVFGLGIAFATLSMIYYLKMTDLQRPNPARISVFESLRQFKRPFIDANFRKLLAFFALFIAAQSFGGNLFAAFALETLQMPFTILQATALTHAAGNVVGARLFGFLADRYGNKPVLGILAVALCTTPGMWLFCTPGQPVANAVILISGHLVAGFVWGGIATTQFNLLLATADPDDRANYIGVGLALQAVMGAISPMLGALLMHQLRVPLSPEIAYKWVFIGTMILRFLSVFLLLPVKEPGAVSMRSTLQKIRQVTPKGYLALRRLTTSADVGQRETAMANVAGSNLGLAMDELIKSLHDPSPRLRRQAAASLAKIGDDSASEALAHMLEDHPDLVEEEMLEALGEIGDPASIPHLERFLDSPVAMLRRAAAKALGRIGDRRAAPALMAAAGNPDDPDLRRAALQGLRAMEAVEAAPVIGQALLDSRPSVRVAAAEAAGELRLHELVPSLRASLARFRDEAGAEIAYALGSLGDPDDIVRVLDYARECASIITRRRCLLGIARRYEVEPEVYRLLLTDGLSRDSALLGLIGSGAKSPTVAEALDLQSRGDENAALQFLAKAYPDLQPLADRPVTESYLVAVCVALNREPKTSRPLISG